MEIKYAGNYRKSHFIYDSFRQSNIKSPLARGLFAFINELTTFKCATLNVIILYANQEKILQKAKTRST